MENKDGWIQDPDCPEDNVYKIDPSRLNAYNGCNLVLSVDMPTTEYLPKTATIHIDFDGKVTFPDWYEVSPAEKALIVGFQVIINHLKDKQ